MAQVELFDVIVVGTRAAGRPAAAQLVDALSRRHGLAPGAVALGLERGTLEIHRGLIKSEAIAAARALHDLGAVAELRAARDVSGVLNIEPDPEEAPTPEPIPIPTPRRAAATPIDLPPPPPSFGVSAPTAPAPATARRPSSIAPPTNAGPIDESAPAISQAQLSSGPAPARFAPPTAGERVELDLAAAGLSAAPVGTSALARSRPATGETRRATGTEIAAVPDSPASSGRFASESMRAPAPMSASMSGMAPAQLPSMEAPGLFAADRVLSGLIGAVAGTVIGIIVAFGWVRGDAAEASATLELELAGSIADPIAVEDGRARAPDVIAKELDEKLADLRSTFFLVWAAIAIPIAGIGAIAKPMK